MGTGQSSSAQRYTAHDGIASRLCVQAKEERKQERECTKRNALIGVACLCLLSVACFHSTQWLPIVATTTIQAAAGAARRLRTALCRRSRHCYRSRPPAPRSAHGPAQQISAAASV